MMPQSKAGCKFAISTLLESYVSYLANGGVHVRFLALRTAPDGLPHVSTYTIGQVLHEAGFRWLAARSWCDSGRAVRRRRSGTVIVTDPDAEAKKN
jgi:hypothetical protein